MAYLIFTTWPDRHKAVEAARKLVEEKRVSCAHVQEYGHSMYVWEGEAQESHEVIVWLKTGARDLTALQERFVELHPHDVPAFIATKINRKQTHGPYFDWLIETSG